MDFRVISLRLTGVERSSGGAPTRLTRLGQKRNNSDREETQRQSPGHTAAIDILSRLMPRYQRKFA
jgi:hypothetical protein